MSQLRTRQVITGRTSDGSDVVISDGAVDWKATDRLSGIDYGLMWASDEIPTVPSDGSRPVTTSFFAPPGGYTWRIVTFAPTYRAVPAGYEARPDASVGSDSTFDGLLAQFDDTDSGMHTSDTVDHVLVLSGEIWCLLGGGDEFCLKAGETCVQNGTSHSWTNKAAEPCTIVSFGVGAQRTE